MALTRIQPAAIADVREPNFRNIVINGDCSVAQRATSAASITTAGYHTIDRYRTAISNGGTWTQSQSTDVPTGQGFATSLKMDCTTADASIGSSDYLHVQLPIEAQNLQYLKYGTDSAQTLTLSFWVKSNKTGTYCICLQKSDTTRYDYVAEYSISSVSTWEKKTIIIAPDSNIKAAGGVIDNNNGEGFKLKFTLLTGSSRYGTNDTWNTSTPADATSNQVNLADSTSNEWYVTGVQLEAGSVATDFEVISYDQNLDRCHRYYQNYITQNDKFITTGGYNAANFIYMWFRFYKTMRANPSLEINTGTNYYTVYRAGGTDGIDSLAVSTNTPQGCMLYKSGESGSAGHVAFLYGNNSDVYIAFSSEL